MYEGKRERERFLKCDLRFQVKCIWQLLVDLLDLCDGCDNHYDDHDVEDGIGELGIPGKGQLEQAGHGLSCYDSE